MADLRARMRQDISRQDVSRQMSYGNPNQHEANKRIVQIVLAMLICPLLVTYFHGPPATNKTTAAMLVALLVNSPCLRLLRRDLRDPHAALMRALALPKSRMSLCFLLLKINELRNTVTRALEIIRARFLAIVRLSRKLRPMVLVIFFDEAHLGSMRFWAPLMKLFTDGTIGMPDGTDLRLPDGVRLLIISAGNPVFAKQLRELAGQLAQRLDAMLAAIPAAQHDDVRSEALIQQEIARGFPTPEVFTRVVHNTCIFRTISSEQMDKTICRCLARICVRVEEPLGLAHSLVTKLAFDQSIVAHARGRLYIHNMDLRAMIEDLYTDVAAAIPEAADLDQWPMLELAVDKSVATARSVAMDRARLYVDADEALLGDYQEPADGEVADMSVDERRAALRSGREATAELEHAEKLLRQCSQQDQYLMHLDAMWMIANTALNVLDPVDNLLVYHPCLIVPDPSVVLLLLRCYRGLHNVPADSWDSPPSSFDIIELMAAWCGALKMHARSIGAGVFRLLVRTNKHKTHLTFALRDAGNWEMSDVDLATSSHEYPLKLDHTHYTGTVGASALAVSLDRWRSIVLRSEQVRASSSRILARLSNPIPSWPTVVEFAVELAPWYEEGGLGDRSFAFFSLAPDLITVSDQVSLSDEAPEEAPAAAAAAGEEEEEDEHADEQQSEPHGDGDQLDVNMEDAQEQEEEEEDEADDEEVEADGEDKEEEEEEHGEEEVEAEDQGEVEGPAVINGVQLVQVLTDDGRVVYYMPLSKDVLAQAFGWAGENVERGHQHVSNRCKADRVAKSPLRHPLIMGDSDCPWQNAARQELYAGMVAAAGKLARFVSFADVRALLKTFEPR